MLRPSSHWQAPCIFRPDDAAPDDLGGYEVELFGHLLADLRPGHPATGTHLVVGLDRDRFGFHMTRDRLTGLSCVPGLPGSALTFAQHLLTHRSRSGGRRFQVLEDLFQLLFLLRSEAICLGAKELATEVLNEGASLLEGLA
jgi:hypothetical protein